MRYLSVFIIWFLLFSSCATILNKKYVQMDVYTEEPVTIVYDGETYKSEENSISLEVKRQKKPVVFEVWSDSIYKKYEIPSKLSPTIWFNIYPSIGLGFIPDMISPKRFTFPKGIYINTRDRTNFETVKFDKQLGGETYFYFSIPINTSYLVKPNSVFNHFRKGTRFLGLGIGMDYYQEYDRFVRFKAEYSAGITPENYFSNVLVTDHFSSINVSATWRSQKRYFNLGAGPQASILFYDNGESLLGEIITTDFYPEFEAIILGLEFCGGIQIGPRAFIDFAYRPGFLNLESLTELKYQHTISIGFSFRGNKYGRLYGDLID